MIFIKKINNVLIFARSRIDYIFNTFIAIWLIISTLFDYLFEEIKNIESEFKHIDEIRKKLNNFLISDFVKVVTRMHFYYKNQNKVFNLF